MAYARCTWETQNIYSQQHDRWFEPLSRHLPGPEHLAVYRALMPYDWRTRERGLWIVADPPELKLPGQASYWRPPSAGRSRSWSCWPQSCCWARSPARP